jgi:hypothetical protein
MVIAFAVIRPIGKFGTLARARTELDASLVKTTAITERLKTEFRAEQAVPGLGNPLVRFPHW